MAEPVHQPPRLAERLLSRLLPSCDRAPILGDLAEEYTRVARREGPGAAHRWYWIQVLKSAAPAVRRRLVSARTAAESAQALGDPSRTRLIDAFFTGELLMDLRYAFRSLLRAPGFTLVAIPILALGIGANTAVFSLVSALFLRPLPFPEPERLVLIWEDHTAIGGPTYAEPAPANFVDWGERSRSFSAMAALEAVTLNLTDRGEPERVAGLRVTGEISDVLRMRPLVGRGLTPEDEGPGASPVVVLGERFWRRRFGGDPGVLGESIVLEGLGRTVVGVIPDDFRFPNGGASVWVPALFTPEELARRTSHYLYVVARLRADASLESARTEMSALAAEMAAEHPDSNGAMTTAVVELRSYLAEDTRSGVLLLLGGSAFVLLITCANVANLLLVRSARRQGELAVRQAMGAGRARILRQVLIESGLLAAVGMSAGAALAGISFGFLRRLIPETFPVGVRPSLDFSVLAFTVAVTGVTVLLVGAAPARAAARGDAARQIQRLGPRSIGRGARLRNALVVAELTLTVVLLAGAGLLLRSHAMVAGVDPGFEAEGLLLAETELSTDRYARFEDRTAFYRAVLERIQALPGVEGAAYVNYPPLTLKGGRAYVTLEDAADPPPEQIARNIVSDRVVSSDYFRTLGIPLLAGRMFDERDRADAAPVALVNATMARRLWPDGDPVGSRIKLGPRAMPGAWATVVGVVGDVHQMGLEVAPEPEVYFPLDQPIVAAPFFWPKTLVIRTQGEPTSLATGVREAIRQVDPDQPVSEIRPMTDVLQGELVARGTQLTLLGIFAVLALVLAAVGIYGVLAYTVAQRTSEIGLRMALGAPRSDVLRSVVMSAGAYSAAGIGLGLAVAAGVTRLLQSFLYGVAPTDARTYAAVSVVLLLASVAASYVPARRAADVDPLTALKAQ
jgi:predicted permease